MIVHNELRGVYHDNNENINPNGEDNKTGLNVMQQDTQMRPEDLVSHV